MALEAEIPNRQDFKATFIGDTSVVVTRHKDGSLHAFVNRCAHRGALVCREPRGNRATQVGVSPQWSYDLVGNLIGVPFWKGIGGASEYTCSRNLIVHNEMHYYRIYIYTLTSFSEKNLLCFLVPSLQRIPGVA